MGQAAFRAAAAASRVHAGGWSRAYLLMFSITGRSGGLAMVAIAAGLAGLAHRSGWRWKCLTIAGTGLIGVFVGLAIRDFWPHTEGSRELFLVFLTFNFLVFLTINTLAFVALPACLFLARRMLARHWLDRAVRLLSGERARAHLCIGASSTGSWANYGVQAIVFASVLTARALDRACAHATITVGGCAARGGTARRVDRGLFDRVEQFHAAVPGSGGDQADRRASAARGPSISLSAARARTG